MNHSLSHTCTVYETQIEYLTSSSESLFGITVSPKRPKVTFDHVCWSGRKKKPNSIFAELSIQPGDKTLRPVCWQHQITSSQSSQVFTSLGIYISHHLHWMTLIGPNLQPAILRVGAELKALFVICGHDSLDVFQRVWAEVRVSQKILHKQEAIYMWREMLELWSNFSCVCSF